MKNRNTKPSGFDAVQWARSEGRRLSIYEYAVLLNLATRCDASYSCFPDQRLIAADIGISRRTVIRALKSLAEKNLLTVQRRRNTSSRYVLHVSGSDSVVTLGSDTVVTSGSDCQMHHKNHYEEPLEEPLEVCVDKMGENSNEFTQGERESLDIATGKKEKLESIPCGKEKAAQIPNESHTEAQRIVTRYWKSVPTQKAMVGFWWALMRHYFPEYPTRKLTGHQFRALKSVFDAFGDSAFYIIAAAVSEWDQASHHAAEVEGLKPKLSGSPRYGDIPKQGPTPTFISKAATGFADYWNQQRHKAAA